MGNLTDEQAGFLDRVRKTVRATNYDAVATLLHERFGSDLPGAERPGEFVARLIGGEVAPGEFDSQPGQDTHIFDRLMEPTLFDLDRESPLGTIPEAYDFLAKPVAFSIGTCLNKILNWTVTPSKPVAIIAACRNEGPWLLEWIAYHRALGVNDIYLGYNDVDDESDELIRALAKNGYVFAVENSVDRSVSPQKKFYNYCNMFIRSVQQYSWVLFLDIDEFLLPAPEVNGGIPELLDLLSQRAPDAQALCLHWKWMSSKYQYDWVPGLVTDRFSFANSETWVKSAVRPEFLWSMHHVHFPEILDPHAVVNSAGNAISVDDGRATPSVYELGQINHYFAKSFQEFCLKKVRGRGAGGLKAEPRKFEDFLWGQAVGSAAGSLRKNIRNSMRVELADMNSVSAVRLLQHETVGLSRDRVKELEKQQQIRAEYERILDAEWTNTEGGSGGLGFPLFGGRSSGAATSTR